MAEDVTNLLKGKFTFRDLKWFKNQFRVKLIEKGYSKMNNYIYQNKLREDFIDFYGKEYLELVQSPLENTNQNWLSYMVTNNNRTTYSIRYLLLARFLEIPLDTLFNVKLGMNENDNDIGLNGVDSYNELWKERLKELVELNLSIREIASILESTPKTIRKVIDQLDIKPFWKYNGGGKYIKKKYIETDEFKTKRDNSRRKWVELLNQYPDKSSNQLRQEHQSLYRWLSKYDIEWLRKQARKSKIRHCDVDWNQRDRELLEKVKQVVKEMQEDKPERITWTTIGSRLGFSGWMSKRKEKLPLTKAYLEFNKETLQEFQIKKIKWAVNELEKEGKDITVWNLVETSGVKPRYLNSINKEIKTYFLENKIEL